MKTLCCFVILFFNYCQLLSQLSWINYIYNDNNNSYFYCENGISNSQNTVITARSYFSQNNNLYYTNYQINSTSGQPITDTSFTSTYSGVITEKCLSYSNGYILALTYNPQTSFTTELYQFFDNNGSPLFSIVDDSVGRFVDAKIYNDTIYCLVEEYGLRIKKYSTNGNFISFISVDTNSTTNRFIANSFIIADSSYR